MPFTLMGVVNLTPDSFSDGGSFLDSSLAVSHSLRLLEDGAEILDFGGESTRPGALSVSSDDEISRVIPVIEQVHQQSPSTKLSIDTTKYEVADAAVRAGATFVNDVSAFRAVPQLAELVAQEELECCLMHMQGEPRTMQKAPRYDDVVSEVKSFLEERLAFAVSCGIPENRVMLDPGIGFGKSLEHNLKLLNRIGEIVSIGRPVVIGTSRKSFIGAITGREANQRIAGTIASNVMAFERGASVFRVHDVGEVRDALSVSAATVTEQWTTTSKTS